MTPPTNPQDGGAGEMVEHRSLSDHQIAFRLSRARELTNGHDYWADYCEELYQEQQRRAVERCKQRIEDALSRSVASRSGSQYVASLERRGLSNLNAVDEGDVLGKHDGDTIPISDELARDILGRRQPRTISKSIGNPLQKGVFSHE